ncbi:MAG: tetratricopeptide repeat protein [Myxococcota bacterium]
MSGLTDKPMARAHEHLASARYAEAAGAFRAVLHIDPNAFHAHFGLADALVARGQFAEAIEGLVNAAESCVAQDDHAAALTLYGKALGIDPTRLELHLDVAMAEAALGRDEAAYTRLENLAETYMQAGRTDEAAEMYRFLTSWDEEREAEEAEAEADAEAHDEADYAQAPVEAAAPEPAAPVEPAAPAAGGVPGPIASEHTVMVPTILITPDGQLLQMAIDRQPSAPVPLPKDDTIPPVPEALIEAAHSRPIVLDDTSGIEQVEGTVVAFPPPPPELTEEAKAAAPEVSREDLEEAVSVAMENLAQLEELEEQAETVILTRPLLPRRKKIVWKDESAAAAAPTPTAKPGKLRIDRAPRPKPTSPKPSAAAPSPGPASPVGSKPSAPAKGPLRIGKSGPGKARVKPLPRPASAATQNKPAATPTPKRPLPQRAAPARPAATPSPERPAATPRPRPRPRPRPASTAKPAPRTPAAAPSPKPTRPDNPLVQRLRRRAGLNKEQAQARGEPQLQSRRATRSISLRQPTGPKSGKDSE